MGSGREDNESAKPAQKGLRIATPQGGRQSRGPAENGQGCISLSTASERREEVVRGWWWGGRGEAAAGELVIALWC